MMPPKNRYIGIILWWLIIMPFMIFISSIMIDSQITRGDILAFVVPITIAIIIYAGSQYYYRHNFYALKVNPKGYLHPDYENKLRSFQDNLVIPLGESTHSLVLKVKADVILKHVHFHLNDKRRSKGLTQKEIVEIVSLDRPPDVYPAWNSFSSSVNSIGGCDGFYQDPAPLIKNSFLYLEIKFNAHQVWKGYLVFYSQRGVVNGRGHAYLPIEVKDK